MKRSTKIFLFAIGLGLGLNIRKILKQSKPMTQIVGPHLFKWLAKDASIEDLAAELEASGKRNMQQLMEKMPTERNYRLLNHIIGIERWGQQRLQVALGKPLIKDEYGPYRPPFGLSWNELQDVFNQTRLETLSIANQINLAGTFDGNIFHNDLGDISVHHWLYYLRLHANSEMWKMN